MQQMIVGKPRDWDREKIWLNIHHIRI